MANEESDDEDIKVTDIKPHLLKKDLLIELANHLIEENASFDAIIS